MVLQPSELRVGAKGHTLLGRNLQIDIIANRGNIVIGVSP
jgi:hypothetical protein